MNIRHVNPEGLHRSPAFSQAVVVEQPTKTIYVGGQNGVDAEGQLVGTTLAEQSLQVPPLVQRPPTPQGAIRR